MESEIRNCQNCKNDFVIELDDFGFYEKIKVLPPSFCPECRLIRRLAWRNERALYKRKCDLCGKDDITMFSPESLFKAYCFSCWWSDKWDGIEYARDYDFFKPFFEQWRELLLAVPRPGNIKQGNNVNSEYTNRVSDMRNCYLIFGCTVAEDCMYGSWMNDDKECVDCLHVQKSERCYECIDCINCYDLSYSQESRMCSSSAYLYNCRDCESCFGCVNLRSKSNYIFNKPYSKEDYIKKVKELKENPKLVEIEMTRLKAENCVPFSVYSKIVRSTGNWLYQTKNVNVGFDCLNVEDGAYLTAIFDAKDVRDYCYWGESELIYEAINLGIQSANVKFANECWNSLRDSEYVMNCHSSINLFGCIGLRNKEYCIFNKQYTKDEYEKLVAKIKIHMDEMPFIDQEGKVYKYGEFYPSNFSPFAYNETIAQEYFPSNREKILREGLMWQDPYERDYKIGGDVVACANGGKPETMCTTAFRLIPAELNFYKKIGISLPKLCPNCRHFARLEKRNPLHLWTRSCMCSQDNHNNHKGQCEVEFETSYAPERPEIVYCEKCYQQEVY